jgi:hypothetical protein
MIFYDIILFYVSDAKNVRVKLGKKIIISCNFGTLLFYTLISSNTTLRYIFAQGILESHLELTSNALVADIRTNAPEVVRVVLTVVRVVTNSIFSFFIKQETTSNYMLIQ